MIKKMAYKIVLLLAFSGSTLAVENLESNIAKEVHDQSWLLTQKASRMLAKLSEDLELVKLRFANVHSIRQNNNFLLDLTKKCNKNSGDLFTSMKYLTETLIPQLKQEIEAKTVDRHEAALAMKSSLSSLELAVSVVEAQRTALEAFVSILEKGTPLALLEDLVEMLQEIQQNSTRTAAAI